MTHDNSPSAIGARSSLLDRASLQNGQALTEVQALTDQLASTFLQEATNLRTAAAMLGAGWVGRATRIGAMGSLPGRALLPQLVRGASYIPAMAAESAAFAGIERGFHNLEGHPSHQSFQSDWARAAVTLTGLKAFGALGAGQNLFVQHLVTDVGLVGSQHLVHAAGLTPAPRGSLAQQLLHAEATNLQMMGSMAMAHGLSPRLSAVERSLDIYLRSEPTRLPIPEVEGPLSSALATAAAGEVLRPATTNETPETGARALTVFSIGSRDGLSGARGAGRGAPRQEMSVDDLTRIFRGDEPPADARAVTEMVERHGLMDYLEDGKIVVGLQESIAKIPTTYDVAILRASPQQVFKTLLDINATGAWMPRLEYFRTVGDDAMDTTTLQRALDGSRLSVTQKAQGRFRAGSILASPLIFQGNFLFTFRNIPGGQQMSWELKGPQDFTERDAKKMSICNSSFTVIPAPNRSDWTLLAHNIHVEPQSGILNTVLMLFFPGAHKTELSQFMTGLANRSLVSSWTVKDKDPIGLEVQRAPNPSNTSYSLLEL